MIALLIVIGVIQGTLQIKASESDVESNCSSNDSENEGSAERSYFIKFYKKAYDENIILRGTLYGYQLFFEHMKSLLKDNDREIRKLKAQLKEREELIEHQRYTIQDLSSRAIKSSSFP